MTKKSNILKNLLATASAVAVLAGGVESAVAAALNITAEVPALVAGGAYGTGLSGNFADGDNLTQTAGGFNVTTAGNVTIASIANGGQPLKLFTTNNVSTIAGALEINVAIGGAGRIAGGAGTNIEGTLLLNSTDATGTTVNDVTGLVTLTAGKLTMGDATGAVNMVAGTLSVGTSDTLAITAGEVTKFGNVANNMTIGAGALVSGGGGIGNVGGTLVINTTSAGQNRVGNVAGAVTLTAGKLTMGDATGGAVDVMVDGGELTEIGTVGRHLLVNGGTVIKFGNVTGNVATANDALITGVGGAGNVGGTLVINTTSAGQNKVGNVAGAVTLTRGNLTMGNAGTAGAADVILAATAGTLSIGDISKDLLVNGGRVTKFGTVTRNLTTANNALVDKGAGAGDVTGAVIINTANAGMNIIGNAANTVTLTAGNLTMGNATAVAADVTVTAGTLSIGNVARHLLVNGGSVTKFGNVTGNLTTAGDSLVGTGGAGNVGNVNGAVVINTVNAGMNTIGNAANAVTLTAGNLTMGNAGTAGAAADVILAATAGTLSIGNVSRDLLVNGGSVTKFGTVTRNLTTTGDSLVDKGAGAGDVTGAVIINTANAGMNIIGDVGGAVTLTAGNLTMGNATAVGADVIVDGGELTEIGTVRRHLLVNGGTVVQFGDVNGDLEVRNGGVITGVGGAGNINGTVTLQATAGAVKIGTANGNVGVAGGNLTMGNAIGAANVAISGGQITQVGTIAGNLTSTGGTVVQFGDVNGDLDVRNGGVITGVGGAGNINGTVTLQATAGAVKIGTANGNVGVAGGNLTMGNAIGAANVAISGGQITQVGTIAGNLTSTGGTVVQFGDVNGDLDVRNGGVITGVGGAGNINGTVTLQATAGAVKIGTANGNVGVAGGNLTMGNAIGAANVAISGGQITEVGTIAGNLTSTGGTVIKFGNVTGNLTTAGNSLVGTGGAGNVGNVTGDVTIDTNNAGMNIIGDVGRAVTLTRGNLTMDDAGTAGAANVTLAVTAGTLSIGEVSQDLLVNGGSVTKFGEVVRDLKTDNDALVKSGVALGFGDVGRDVVIDTTNGGMNEIRNVGRAVTLTAGNLTMGNAGTAAPSNVTVTAGTLSIGNVSRDLLVNGGSVTQFGTVTRNLTTANNALVDKGAGAGNVTGAVIINTANPGMNIIGDVGGAVTLTAGNLDMGDVTGLITVDGANSSAGVVNVKAGAVLTNGGTLTVYENINGNTTGNGTLVLGGNRAGIAQEVRNEVGTLAIPLAVVVFDDRDVTFRSAGLHANVLEFSTGENGITVTTAGVDLGAKNITKPGGGDNHTLVVSGNQNLTGNIANFGNIRVDGVSTVTIGAACDFAAGLTANAANEVSLVVQKDAIVFTTLGSGHALKEVDFQENASVTGGTSTGTAKIAAGKTVSFGGPLTATTLTLSGAGSTAGFADGAVMNSDITPTVPGEGIVNFAGSAEIKKAIGRIKEVNFKGVDRTKEVKLAANIGGMAKFEKSSVTLEKDIDMTAGASFAGTPIDLGSNKLTISGGNVTLSGDVAVKTVLTQNGVGNIVLNPGAGNTINLAAMNSLVITVDDSAVGVLNGVHTYTLLATNSGTITGFDASKITDGNPDTDFSRWTISSDQNGKVTLVSTNQTGDVLRQQLDELDVPDELVSAEGVEKFENVEPGTQAAEFRNLLNSLSKEDRVEALIRIENNTAVSNTEVISDALSDVSSQISTRVASMITPMSFTASPSNALKTAFDDGLPVSGVAAGDDAERYGIWVNPFYSENTQKKRGVASAGHKSRSSGITAGFDTRATEDMIIGAAATFINTNVTHKDFKKGDKTKVDSLMFSVYGVQQMANNWYVQGIANFGSSRVKNNENRGGGNNKQIAKGNYTSMSFSGEALAGYNYMISEKAVVTPMAGFSYSHFNDGSYRETGAGSQNLDITKRASSKLEGVLGARVASTPFDVNGMAISPEAHAYVRHDLIGKKAKVDVRLDGLGVLSSKDSKTTRTFVNLGTSISAKYSMMDYGIGYDATMANKYIGHQGTLKVRVNF